MPFLHLERYRDAIALDQKFVPAAEPAEPQQFDALARTVLRRLLDEPFVRSLDLGPIDLLGNGEALRGVRAVLNLRPAAPMPRAVLAPLDALLGGERLRREIVDARSITAVSPGTPLSLWQGDLTHLAADAIVNAANSAMLGCFRPLHGCVDNAIHTAAGPQLRLDCSAIMAAQREPEPTGSAKMTRGYHLPARYVLHTVGPVVRDAPASSHRTALTSSYTACLDLAASIDRIRTVAFCAISTGVFGYPKREAAEVALDAISTWIDRNPQRLDRVICCTYTDEDTTIYRDVLQGEAR